MSDISIREANSLDIESLCKLYFEFHEFHVRRVPDRLLSLGEPPDTYEHSELYLALEKIINDDDSALFLTEVARQPIGLAEIYI